MTFLENDDRWKELRHLHIADASKLEGGVAMGVALTN